MYLLYNSGGFNAPSVHDGKGLCDYVNHEEPYDGDVAELEAMVGPDHDGSEDGNLKIPGNDEFSSLTGTITPSELPPSSNI